MNRMNQVIQSLPTAFAPLAEVLEEKVHVFCDANHFLYPKPSVQTRGRKPVAVKMEIDFAHFTVGFYYMFSNIISKSILYCMLSFEYAPKIPFFFTDLLAEEEIRTCQTVVFSSIESPQRMGHCFDAIAAVLLPRLEWIGAFAADPHRVNTLAEKQKSYICAFHNIPHLFEHHAEEWYPVFREHALDRFVRLSLMRFEHPGFLHLLKGNVQKAQKSFAKMKLPSRYESAVIDYVNTLCPQEAISVVSPVCNSMVDGKKAQSGLLGLLVLLFSMFVFSPFLCLPFAGLYYLFASILTEGCLYATALEPYQLIPVVLPALICSVGLTFFTQNKLLFFIKKDRREKIRNFNRIFTSTGETRFMRGLFGLVLTGAVLFTLFMAGTGVVFYDAAFRDRSGFFDLKGTLYTYKEIDTVYLLNGRYNEHGDWLDHPSLLLQMKNNQRLDLFEFAAHKDILQNVLPILESKGFTPVSVKHIDLLS